MPLTNQQIGAMHKALCGAFNLGEFDMMLRLELDRDLEQLVGNKSLREAVFETIRIADRQGWHRRLIQAAVTTVPENPGLKQFLSDHPGLLGQSRPKPLPPRPPACIGRQILLERLEEALLPADESATLKAVTVSGVGGIGKSTAVLWFLHLPQVKARYGSQRHFIPLDGATSHATLVGKIAESLGIPPGPGVEDRLWAELDTGGRRLIALDNAETPLESADRLKVENFLGTLAGYPHVGLVAALRPTSPIPGWESADVVTGLKAPDDLATFCHYAGKHLETDPPAAAFVATLEGWPLIIRLAATHAKDYRRIADFQRLWHRERTELLQQGDDRASNLAVCVNLSLNSPAMRDHGRRLLAVLARLPDGIREEDLPRVVGDEAHHAAAVVRKVGGLVTEAAGRLKMLASLREHLETVLPFEGEDRQRAVAFYCEIGKRRCFAPSKEWDAANARLAQEIGNVGVMIQFGLGLRDRILAYDAVQGLGVYGQFVGLDFSEPLRIAARVAKEKGDQRAEANCAKSLGDIALSRSDHAGAMARYEEALPLYRRAGAVLGEANCIRNLGDIARERSDHAGAVSRYEEALPLYRRVEDVLGVANCIQGLGDIASERSDHVGAVSRYEEALLLYRQVGDVVGEATCIQRRGDIALSRSDHVGAMTRYEEALLLYRRVGSVLGEANCIQGLGDIAKAKGDTLAARHPYLEALRLYRRIEEPYSIGLANRRLALIVTDPAERTRFVEAARTAWASIDRPDLVATLDREFPPDPPPAPPA